MAGKILRFDLGSRTAAGDHGLIAAHDAEISPHEMSRLLEYADSTRAPFQEHWFCVPLSPARRGLLRVSPQAGGLRGMASTTQAVVIDEKDIGWATDLCWLVDALPEAPEQIGQQASWCEAPLRLAEASMDVLARFDACRTNLQRVVFATGTAGRLSRSECANVRDEARSMLDLYSFSPAPVRRRRLAFSSSSAPALASGNLQFQDAASNGESPVSFFAWCTWLQALGAVDPLVDPASEGAVLAGYATAFADALAREHVDAELVGRFTSSLAALQGVHKEQSFLGQFESALLLVPAAPRVQFLRLLIDEARERRTLLPPFWTHRQLARPQTLPYVTPELLTRVAFPIVQHFAASAVKSVPGLSKLQVQALLGALDELLTDIAPHDNLGPDHATLFHLLLDQSVERAEAMSELIPVCLLLRKGQAQAIAPGIASACVEWHRNIVARPAVYGPLLSEASLTPELYWWLLFGGVQAGSHHERLKGFQHTVRPSSASECRTQLAVLERVGPGETHSQKLWLGLARRRLRRLMATADWPREDAA